MLHTVQESVIAEYSFYEKYEKDKNYLQAGMATVSR